VVIYGIEGMSAPIHSKDATALFPMPFRPAYFNEVDYWHAVVRCWIRRAKFDLLAKKGKWKK
jgi:hypothetical protein